MTQELRRRFKDAQIARKPEGGYVFINGVLLLAAWAAFRRGHIQLRDLRVWLATFEVLAQRCKTKKGRTPRFRVAEVARLTGMARDRDIRTALNLLQRLGLVSWNIDSIYHSHEDAERAAPDSDAIFNLVTRVANSNRKIPIPRRMVRHLCLTKSRASIAVVLGMLFRCMYFRKGQCVSWGTCRASWIAETFEIDVRSVKSARRSLIAAQWIIPQEANQHRLNRWGMIAVLNLAWGKTTRRRSKSPPPRDRSAAKSPPPIHNKKLSTKSKNPKPATRGPQGVYSNRSAPWRPLPINNLEDPQELKSLYEELVEKETYSRAEADRLNFFAAAEHAKRVGRHSPVGLFAYLIRTRRWEFISQADEDAARQSLRQFDDGGMQLPENLRGAADIIAALNNRQVSFEANIEDAKQQRCRVG